MKISKEIFSPITILLETEEEARLMWHKLNISRQLFKEYAKLVPECTKQDLDFDNIMGADIWSQYNKIYPIQEVKDED